MKNASIENKRNSSASVSRLFDSDEGELPWQAEELKEVVKHQLSAPVQFDLAGFDRRLGDRLHVLAASEGLLLQSFNDLFMHPNPPVQMLELVKDYAKRAAAASESVPKDFARALYYLSIVVARLRCQQRISTLDDDQLVRGVGWLLDQEWLDTNSRQILTEGLAMLNDRQEQK